MTAPIVTIGIPTVNRLAYLIEAVESALAQTWPHIEVLVGHDGDGPDVSDWCRARAERDGTHSRVGLAKTGKSGVVVEDRHIQVGEAAQAGCEADHVLQATTVIGYARVVEDADAHARRQRDPRTSASEAAMYCTSSSESVG